ncbi:MAG: DNA repair exonuclease [Thermodesulfobacteriota bacterium]|nr:DNA repair exonuclease [Thermodesulfobacteriota bacterium]
MLKFLHAADIHLDSPLKGLEAYEDAPVDEIRGATRKAFDNLISLAIEEKVAFVLIAGDLFDGDWKDYNSGIFFANRMGKLAREGIKVFIVSGNHDAACPITKTMALPDNVTLFSRGKPQSVTLETQGVIIHGRSYPSRTVTDNLASSFPEHTPGFLNIGLLHTSLTGHAGHETYAPCTLDDLNSKGYDYWALGHVHQKKIISETPWIVFPGNIQGRHIRETGPKGAVLVHVKNDTIHRVEHRELDVLRWAICQADVSGCTTQDMIHDQIRTSMEEEHQRALGKPMAIRLELEGSCICHNDLHSRFEHWIEAFHTIAAGLGQTWLEKVKISTRRKTGTTHVSGENLPFSDIVKAVENLNLNQGTLTEMDPDIASLKGKLTSELIQDNPVFSGNPEVLTELKDSVRELLISRLMHKETGL